MNAMQINADDALQHKLDVIYSCFMVQTMKLFAQLLNIQQSLLIPAYKYTSIFRLLEHYTKWSQISNLVYFSSLMQKVIDKKAI